MFTLTALLIFNKYKALQSTNNSETNEPLKFKWPYLNLYIRNPLTEVTICPSRVRYTHQNDDSLLTHPCVYFSLRRTLLRVLNICMQTYIDPKRWKCGGKMGRYTPPPLYSIFPIFYPLCKLFFLYTILSVYTVQN